MANPDMVTNVGEALRHALTHDDGAMAVRAAEILRGRGWGHEATYRLAERNADHLGKELTRAEWDGLLYEGETS